jgi:hypothetical protein
MQKLSLHCKLGRVGVVSGVLTSGVEDVGGLGVAISEGSIGSYCSCNTSFPTDAKKLVAVV